MSGIAIKITTLVIRTVSKPIANRIKSQAREHERFRRICVGWAQFLHRLDMRLRLGLLQEPAATKLGRQAQREAKKAPQAEIPTVKTEAQARADEQQVGDKVGAEKKKAAADARPKIKPLSEAKAIDMGANFIAESFLFMVAVGTLVFDQYRSRKKESTRRSDVADKLEELEASDRAKSEKIDQMEKEIRELKGQAHWQWPWKKGHPGASGGQAPGTEQEASMQSELKQAEQPRTINMQAEPASDSKLNQVDGQLAKAASEDVHVKGRSPQTAESIENAKV